MASKKKLLQAAAGSAGGAGLDVDEVFSTYLYDGTGSAQTITNGIDLSGEGGLVWTKTRSVADNHRLTDTARGAGKGLDASNTYAEWTANPSAGIPSGVSSFNSNGFVSDLSHSFFNNEEVVTWTFRKAPKFFDVVTFSTTTGSSTPITVNHNLNSVPGTIIVKTTSISADWFVFHRSLGSTKYLALNSTDQAQTGGTSKWASAPTDTSFTLGGDFVQNATYVAYLFAHNDGDGGFGPDGDADIIKCGSFTGTSSGEVSVNLGFEPQFIIYKLTNNTNSGDNDNWRMHDVMRGWDVSNRQLLNPNESAAESSLSNTGGYEIKPTATGFIHEGHAGSSGSDYIYMAIRRGPLAAPESGTDVFAVAARTGASGNQGAYRSGFPVDMAFHKVVTSSANPYEIGSRLTQGNSMNTTDTSAETTQGDQQYDYMDGWNSEGSSSSTKYAWMWKRAPSYFDCVCYSGTGSARTVSHNLTVQPEMMWVKSRSDTHDWVVYHSALGNGTQLNLNTTNAAPTSSSADYWNLTTPTDSVFTLGSQFRVNGSSKTYIAYLFATVAGVSSVGSYSGNGSTTGPTVDCGFSGSPRFILIKRTANTGSWYVFDSVRGIVAGAESQLYLNSTAAEQTATDQIDPTSSGFQIVTNATGLNSNGETYIYYAIA